MNYLLKKRILYVIIPILILGCSTKTKVVDKWENGKPKESRYYENINDPYRYIRTIYYENGQIREVGFLIEREQIIKQGEWKYYYPNGNLKRTITYDQGVAYGEYKIYHKNGKLQEAGNFDRETHTDGKWSNYYSNGVLRSKGVYNHGTQCDNWDYYDRSGVKIKDEKLAYNGNLLLEKEYLPCGRIKIVEYNGAYIHYHGFWKNNKKDSLWCYYYENGSKLKEVKYTNGTPQLMGYWDESGKQLVVNGNGTYTITDYKLKQGRSKKVILIYKYKNGYKIN